MLRVLVALAMVVGIVGMHEVYLERGEQLSGASVGAVREKRLLIGPIADSKFLDCRMQ